jgi:hypothetical protein
MTNCKSDRIGNGVQLFRIRDPQSIFDVVEELEPDHTIFIAARAVWRCKFCGDLFAYLKIPYKDEEEIIVRAKNDKPATWDRSELVHLAGSVRWRGSRVDKRWVV